MPKAWKNHFADSGAVTKLTLMLRFSPIWVIGWYHKGFWKKKAIV